MPRKNLDQRCVSAGEKGCNALDNVSKCSMEHCVFAKTHEQAARDCAEANARIASLDADTQAHISMKYYRGKTPWNEGKEDEIND